MEYYFFNLFYQSKQVIRIYGTSMSFGFGNFIWVFYNFCLQSEFCVKILLIEFTIKNIIYLKI